MVGDIYIWKTLGLIKIEGGSWVWKSKRKE